MNPYNVSVRYERIFFFIDDFLIIYFVVSVKDSDKIFVFSCCIDVSWLNKHFIQLNCKDLFNVCSLNA